MRLCRICTSKLHQSLQINKICACVHRLKCARVHIFSTCACVALVNLNCILNGNMEFGQIQGEPPKINPLEKLH